MISKPTNEQASPFMDCNSTCTISPRHLHKRRVVSRVWERAPFRSFVATLAFCIIVIEARGQAPVEEGVGQQDSSEESAENESNKIQTAHREGSPKDANQGTDTPAKDVTSSPFDLRTTPNLTGDWGGHRTELEKRGIAFDLYYNQQFQQDFRGGLDTHNGHRFSGSYDLNLKLDFEKLGWMDDAGFFLRAAKGTWSDGINPNKVGALFNVNSDAGDDHPIFINKWWLWKKFADGKFELRLGLLQTNKDLFDVSLYANHEDKDFLNRLSIRNGTFPHRTGNGVFLKYEPVNWFYTQIAAIDADHQSRTTGWDTAFHDRAWFAGFGEAGFTPKWESSKGPMPGRYRVGVWYDPRTKTLFRNTLGNRRRAETNDGTAGYYFGADQMVWKEQDDPSDSQGLGLFARYGHARSDRNRISDSWQLGASYRGLISTRDKDVFAFSVAQAMESQRYRDEIRRLADRETVYEVYYAIQVAPWIIVSPDVQFITNPGGDRTARDAIVGGVRVRIIF